MPLASDCDVLRQIGTDNENTMLYVVAACVLFPAPLKWLTGMFFQLPAS